MSVCVCIACIRVFETAEVCKVSVTVSTGLGMGKSNVRRDSASWEQRQTELQA